MMKRALLYIALDFPPLNSSGTYRNAKFVKYLPRFGWQPVVVTLDWHRERGENPLDAALLEDIPKQTPILRLPPFNPAVTLHRLIRRRQPEFRDGTATLTEIAPDRRPRHLVYRLTRSLFHAALAPLGDVFFYWNFRALPACLRWARRHRVEAVFVSLSPWTTALLGLMLKRKLGRPLIVDFRDYWTMWAVKGEPTLRDRLDAHVERWILRRADRLICVHHAMARDFQALEPRCTGKCRVITNGYDPDDFPRLDSIPAPSANPPAPLRLVHAGLVWGDAARPLLEALARLESDLRKHLRVTFVGGLPPSQIAFVKRHRLDDCVRMEPRVPHRQAIERMCQADLLLLLIVDNEGGRKWYPGKLFEYMYAHRPILAIAPRGIATQLIREAGVGWAVEPQDIDGLTRLLKRLVTERSAVHGYYHPREDVIARFHRLRLAEALASILDELCPPTGSRSAGSHNI
ncbi:MAG: glycosyltransferase [Acidobacteria bacterium]|nr:MAG: glycosyltransferase [Acidobacteriota bacterium]